MDDTHKGREIEISQPWDRSVGREKWRPQRAGRDGHTSAFMNEWKTDASLTGTATWNKNNESSREREKERWSFGRTKSNSRLGFFCRVVGLGFALAARVRNRGPQLGEPSPSQGLAFRWPDVKVRGCNPFFKYFFAMHACSLKRIGRSFVSNESVLTKKRSFHFKVHRASWIFRSIEDSYEEKLQRVGPNDKDPFHDEPVVDPGSPAEG